MVKNLWNITKMLKTFSAYGLLLIKRILLTDFKNICKMLKIRRFAKES